MAHRRALRALEGLGMLIGAFAGCGGAEDGQGLPLKPAVTIVVDGSSTVYRISKAAQEGFSKVSPDVTVIVDNHGTGGGFARYLQGEVDIVDASRPAKADEEAKAKAQGIEWTRLLVGYDGVTVVVNAGNDFAKALTVAELKALWEPSSRVKAWKDLDASWPDRRIILYSPDSDSGTFEFFTEVIVGKAREQRDDVQPSSDDNILVKGVAGDPDGMGYFGYAYFAANRDKLRAIAVGGNSREGAVLPSPETILDKTYAPLSRPLFIYVKASAARRPEVASFLKYYMDNIEQLAAKGGYNAPTADDRAANQQVLAKLLSSGAGESAATPAAKD
jgi:phosphate transport system substrate-binding protein